MTGVVAEAAHQWAVDSEVDDGVSSDTCSDYSGDSDGDVIDRYLVRPYISVDVNVR